MTYSKDLYDSITSYLDNDNWHYTFNEERHVIECATELECKFKKCNIIIDVRETNYLVLAFIPLNTDEEQRKEMASLLNMINYSMLFGDFEMDPADGEIRVRVAVDADGALPSAETVKNSIIIPPLMIDRYGNAIAAVMMGFSNAEEAFNSIDKEKS